MPLYKYVVKDRTGKTMTETLESVSRAALIDNLRKRDLIIISIDEEKARKKALGKTGEGVKLDDLVVFSRQLATLVDAGIPLVGALDILSEQIERKSFKKVVTKLRDDVEGGASLSEAMTKQARVFSALFINMVRAGESSGNLDEILDRVAGYFEKTNALQRKVKSSLVYPTMVVIMATLITAFLILKIVPTFKSIFESIGVQLPTPTRILIAFSDFARKWFFANLGALIAFIFGLQQFVRTEKGRAIFDAFLLKVPLFGILIRKYAIAKFARTLSTLQKSGVSILTSLEIVAKTAGNKVVEAAVLKTKTNVREGESIALPLANSKVFPPMVTRMIAVGEQTGKLEDMLAKIADFYEDEVDNAVSGLTSLIEPLIIAFLGIVIGSIVVSMFLPIIKLLQVVTG